MTPTREQVIEWAKEADLLDARDDESTVPGCYGAGLERFATLAMAAGRAQGLREGAEHALSGSYVRVREAIGAMRPPSLETTEFWAYVEQAARSLTAERDQLRAEVERLRAEVTAARENGFRDGYEQRHAEVLGALT